MVVDTERIDYWQQVLTAKWGVKASLTALDGEFDLNFRVEADNRQRCVLKVMRADCDPALVDLQVRAIQHLTSELPGLPLPKVMSDKAGNSVVAITDQGGTERLVWLIEHLDGQVYAQCGLKTFDLIRSIGAAIGSMNQVLARFKHPALNRDFKWNLEGAEWINRHLEDIQDSGRRRILEGVLKDFQSISDQLFALPRTAIHNDINDHNVLVSLSDDGVPVLSGIIDFGDMCAAPRICDLAIAGAYIVLDHPKPEMALAELVAGYHGVHPLTTDEIDLILPLLRARLAVSVVNSTLMAAERPDDPYVIVSQAPAWRYLENDGIRAENIRIRLRTACGFPTSNTASRALAYIDQMRGHFAPVIGRDLAEAPLLSLSPFRSASPQDPFCITDHEAKALGSDIISSHEVLLGRYREPRLIYTDPSFWLGDWNASDRRTVHLGVDIFAPAHTRVFAPCDGWIHAIENRAERLDFGGVVVLRHETPEGDPFFTLYGHLDPAGFKELALGQKLRRGDSFAELGGPDCNGGWAPHLHFQLALVADTLEPIWPGVADPDDLDLWTAKCPNPAALLNIPDSKVIHRPVNTQAVLDDRHRHFGSNLKLSYRDPVMFVRGWRHYLFDQWGRTYLDAYNNVPHVGHAHPRIVAVASDQLSRMNSNTRYLHPAQTDFADALRSKLPPSLSVCFFVNSGSEANELALRLARAATGGKAMITPDHGYHGNTTGAVGLSAYKFNAPGGGGQPDWVELVDLPDDYRGSFRRGDPKRAEKFAGQIDAAIDRVNEKEGRLAGFIAETFPSVGGQIVPPAGYLRAVYEKIRKAGGICIADEVQTGLGRLGEYYFGFEQQEVIPDVVVLGKPIGNGHPIGVVITTRELADRFADGPEFFSTFGGSTLSCRVGKEVLNIVDDEGLMENARLTGESLIAGLLDLQGKHDCIGDVRGLGLFVGIDLVADPKTRAPATVLADRVMNRLRQQRILIGTEGPGDNVLKVRPPLTIGPDDIEMFLAVLDTSLSEFSQIAMTAAHSE